MKIRELFYAKTNTYLIEGDGGMLLFDTGWAGTFPAFCKALGDLGVTLKDIRYVMISHFHPDHMGIAQEIANEGPILLVADTQREFLHAADDVYKKEKRNDFVPIRDDAVRFFAPEEGREILREIGMEGQVLSTPGHSQDSISLCLDSGDFFVGDLNPLYELELHEGTQIGESWKRLLDLRPRVVYYGHAKKTILEGGQERETAKSSVVKSDERETYALVS